MYVLQRTFSCTTVTLHIGVVVSKLSRQRTSIVAGLVKNVKTFIKTWNILDRKTSVQIQSK